MFLTPILYSSICFMLCGTVTADCWEAVGLQPATGMKPVVADVPPWVGSTFRWLQILCRPWHEVSSTVDCRILISRMTNQYIKHGLKRATAWFSKLWYSHFEIFVWLHHVFVFCFVLSMVFVFEVWEEFTLLLTVQTYLCLCIASVMAPPANYRDCTSLDRLSWYKSHHAQFWVLASSLPICCHKICV